MKLSSKKKNGIGLMKTAKVTMETKVFEIKEWRVQIFYLQLAGSVVF